MAFSEQLSSFLGFVSVILIGAAGIGVVYGWITSQFELASVRALDPGVFRSGPVVLRFDLDDLPATPTRQVASVPGGQYRVLASGRVLFAPRVFLPLPGLGLLNFGAFKGSIDRIEGVPSVSVRATLGGTILLVSLGIVGIVVVLLPLAIYVLTAESCTVTVGGQKTAGGFACLIAGAVLLVPVALLASAVWGGFAHMRRRARRLATEVRARLVEVSAGRVSA